MKAGRALVATNQVSSLAAGVTTVVVVPLSGSLKIRMLGLLGLVLGVARRRRDERLDFLLKATKAAMLTNK